MRRWIQAVAKLYPAKWQQRYGSEFDALLAEVEPSWRQFFNVLGGALKMRLLTGGTPYLKFGAAFAVVGMMIATGLSFAVSRQYTSSAVLRIEASLGSQPAELSDQPLYSAIQVAYSRTSLSEIIQRPGLDLYQRERFQKPLQDVIEEMRSNLRIARIPTNDKRLAISLSFRYKDPQKARQVVTAFIGKLLDAFALERPPAGSISQNFTVMDPPSLPAKPISPNRLVFVGTGLAIGILSGIMRYFAYNRLARQRCLRQPD